jgi:hypothetical protein
VDEENRASEILDTIIEKVQKRRLLLFPFFKPYDRVKLIFQINLIDIYVFLSIE